MNKIIILLVIFALLGGFLFWLFVSLSNKNKKPEIVNLTVWGFDDEQAVKPALQNYETNNPNTKLTYVKQSLINYRTRVQTQIREGSGPDVFLIHNSWIPMFQADIVPVPDSVSNLNDIKATFIPVTVDSVTKGNQVLALPVDIDGLVLFYNEDILAGAGAAPPKNWREFVETATKVTVRDTDGQIKTAGAALGATKNVDQWSQILGLLMFQQPGVDINNVDSVPGGEVLRFYSSFIIDPARKTWDINLANSTQLFTEGKLAFYFGTFDDITKFQSANPSLKFKVVPVPQLSEKPAGWAGFWAETVSIRTAHPIEAWKLAKYLTSSEVVQTSGKPSARLDLAAVQINDPMLNPFVIQNPYYKSWYLNPNTQDSGLNDEMLPVWEGGVDGILKGQDPRDVARSIAGKSKEILDKYGVK
jgi:multiple sugar transport system substrate-binding protein